MKVKLTKIKERRCLTLWGWFLVLISIILLGYIWSITIHGFLAQNKPVDTDIFVVEGYVSDSALDSVARMLNKTHFQYIICAGLPLEKGFMCPGYSSYAIYNAAVFRAKGLDSLKVISAPAQPTDKDRTYTTALAVKEKLNSLGFKSGNLNVICVGTHGRRSLLLYREAFASDWNVGVLSFPSDLYPKAWWRTSEGARAVVYEMFAYLYCFIFFHP